MPHTATGSDSNTKSQAPVAAPTKSRERQEEEHTVTQAPEKHTVTQALETKCNHLVSCQAAPLWRALHRSPSCCWLRQGFAYGAFMAEGALNTAHHRVIDTIQAGCARAGCKFQGIRVTPALCVCVLCVCVCVCVCGCVCVCVCVCV